MSVIATNEITESVDDTAVFFFQRETSTCSTQPDTAIASGKEEGMQSFNMSLFDLIKRELISREDALDFSDNPEELEMNLNGIFLSSSQGGILRK